MRKIFFVDLFNLFIITLGYMTLISLTLLAFDLFEIKTTGSVFLEGLSSITIFKIYSNSIFNGLFTLFLVITIILFLYKAYDLYRKDSK
ncbi:hypothetical protein OXR01_04575 [Staphylococcus gallinarum]|jgi:hypothetical protein|uniref:Uncharacterized protein n=2 Tax=Staphylococcus gallinarum TaxID=1293 RepID=A0A0D0SI99_STAGA|nr:hypothetical protein [Staphylococcus gallinarum]KIR10043.1 hypothetical protein SH09_14610 [Staphylococcus gallinarum]MBU7217777.1 hypothetical protein [Staphylococcus gallinarum]MCD8785225.1 hypothetical protein [Staphylococcus gallinarum]MCD8792500.1 hypothetical protein [Staphylococcus gallinarum]MCD8821984.1 hypothetical protein [Staphylococcus gallinarum]